MSEWPTCPFSIVIKGCVKCTTELNNREKCWKKDDEYKLCHFYNIRRYQDTLPFPQVCPLVMECHKDRQILGDACGDIDPTHLSYEHGDWDYRGCEKFSKWFWKQKAKGVKNE